MRTLIFDTATMQIDAADAFARYTRCGLKVSMFFSYNCWVVQFEARKAA